MACAAQANLPGRRPEWPVRPAGLWFQLQREYKGVTRRGVRVNPKLPQPRSTVAPSSIPSVLLLSPASMALLSLDLVLPLLLLLLMCSSDAKPYPFLHYPRCYSPSSITASQWLGPAIESQDLGARPLLDGAAKRANRRSTRLPHGLNSSGGVPEPDGPTSGDGSVSGDGGGAARVGEVGEVDDVVSIRGASGPWGRSRGPMEMHTVR
jgi:hypothetical protein